MAGRRWKSIEDLVADLQIPADATDPNAIREQLEMWRANVHPDRAGPGSSSTFVTYSEALNALDELSGESHGGNSQGGSGGQIVVVREGGAGELHAIRAELEGEKRRAERQAMESRQAERKASRQGEVARRAQRRRTPVKYAGVGAIAAGLVALPGRLSDYPFLADLPHTTLVVAWIAALGALGIYWGTITLRERRIARLVDRAFDPAIQDNALRLCIAHNGPRFGDDAYRASLWLETSRPWRRLTTSEAIRLAEDRLGDQMAAPSSNNPAVLSTVGRVRDLLPPLAPISGVRWRSMPDGTIEDAGQIAIDRFLVEHAIARVGNRFPPLYIAAGYQD